MQKAFITSNNDDSVSTSRSDDKEVPTATTHCHDSPISSVPPQKRALDFSLCSVSKKMKPLNPIDQSIKAKKIGNYS